MDKIVFLVLLLLAGAVHAGQQQGFKPAYPKSYTQRVYYTVYESATMNTQDLGTLSVVFRGCKKVSASDFIRQEKLAYNRNIAGAFYCLRGQHNGEYYVIVKKLKEPE